MSHLFAERSECDRHYSRNNCHNYATPLAELNGSQVAGAIDEPESRNCSRLCWPAEVVPLKQTRNELPKRTRHQLLASHRHTQPFGPAAVNCVSTRLEIMRKPA